MRQLKLANGEKIQTGDTSLDWMYQAPAGQANGQTQKYEEYLLGKIFKSSDNNNNNMFNTVNTIGLDINNNNNIDLEKKFKKEEFTRIHEDPLLNIRKKEKEVKYIFIYIYIYFLLLILIIFFLNNKIIIMI